MRCSGEDGVHREAPGHGVSLSRSLARRRPDGMRVALLRLFGWPDAPGIVALPADDARRARPGHPEDASTSAPMRVVGDPEARVSSHRARARLRQPAAQCRSSTRSITGEYQEADSAWDNPAYAMDATAFGQAKGLIVLGHEQSEGLGMDECATWLRTIVSDVPRRRSSAPASHSGRRRSELC